jgi:hypothetical protein
MTTKRVESWVVTEDFWARVEPLVPARAAVLGKTCERKPGAGRPPKLACADLSAGQGRSVDPLALSIIVVSVRAFRWP